MFVTKPPTTSERQKAGSWSRWRKHRNGAVSSLACSTASRQCTKHGKGVFGPQCEEREGIEARQSRGGAFNFEGAREKAVVGTNRRIADHEHGVPGL
jgi:hypothetical protein